MQRSFVTRLSIALFVMVLAFSGRVASAQEPTPAASPAASPTTEEPDAPKIGLAGVAYCALPRSAVEPGDRVNVSWVAAVVDGS